MKLIDFNIKTIVVFITLCILSSCKKFLDIPAPKTQAQTAVIFSNNQSALSTVAGLYSQLGQNNLSLLNGGLTVYCGLSADEFYNTAPSSTWDAFTANALTAENSTLGTQFWMNAYKNIYQANSILEGLGTTTSLTDSLKNQLRGEVLTVRALNYFYLVNLFGDVPLISGTDYHNNVQLPRTAVAVIYQQIIADLLAAQKELSGSYASAQRGRINKWTATALLSRAYLYQKDWANAEAQATQVINAGTYSLVSPAMVFQSTSNETIWQLIRDNNNTVDASTFLPSSSTVMPTMALTPYALNGFENGDLRRSAWLARNTIGGADYYYPNKYKNRLTTPINEYQIVFRLAEQYLIRAEARALQNNLNGSLSDLNVIRDRAGLWPVTASDQATVLNLIEKERQCELMAEWGHRWLDLKRTGKADSVLGLEKGTYWQSTDALYPIPLYEIQTNPLLTQNPGYN